MDKAKIAEAVRLIIEAIGEDPQREGLRDTPRRVADMYEEILAGTGQDAREVLEVYFTTENHEEVVMVKDIPFYSICEHHLTPFFGRAHVAYIPRKGRLTGISKLARVVDILAKRPQLQERLTSQTADIIMEKLSPFGVMVVIEAEHLCMSMRGVKKPGSFTVTSAVRGVFANSPATRAEAIGLIGKTSI